MARAGSPRRSIERERLKHEGTHLDARADRENRVARAEQLVDEHAGDAHHSGAAVVALGVELPRLAEEELVLSDLIWQAGK